MPQGGNAVLSLGWLKTQHKNFFPYYLFQQHCLNTKTKCNDCYTFIVLCFMEVFG